MEFRTAVIAGIVAVHHSVFLYMSLTYMVHILTLQLLWEI